MISSTFRDLEEHRAALMLALRKQDLFPVGMETHIPGTRDNIITSSYAMVEKSMGYIGLISHRYGQVIEDTDLNPAGYSVTRLEYEKAQQLGLPTLIFVMHDDHPVKRSEVETDSEKIEKLEAFRIQAQKGRIYLEFTDLEDFKTKAIHAATKLRREIEEASSSHSVQPEARAAVKAEEDKPVIAPPDLLALPPYIGSHQFVGRRAELETLDDWANAADPHTVLLFEAIGGSGKSMLTWEWTKHHASKNRADWAGIFWYSFYEKGALMTDFCQQALAYITQEPVEHFKKKKMPELSELLLQHLRAKPWLFILDGLERVLVAYHRIDAARVRDEEIDVPKDVIIDRNPRAAIRPADDDFILALASANPSKIVVSSRLTPKVLVNPSGQTIPGVWRLPLAGLRPADAEQLIRSCGVFGKSNEVQNYLSKHCACHPLVIGILAGLIIDYLPARGDFDTWVMDTEFGGGQLNLGDLDIVQRRNHILEAGLANLSAKAKQLLSTLSFLTDMIDYPVLEAFNPHPKQDHSGVAPTNPIALLQGTVKELEQRGFLQFDGQFYNLHPVVRGVVAGKLESEKLTEYGLKVVDYFSQKDTVNFAEVESLEEVREVINVVLTLIRIGEFSRAANLYRAGLSTAMSENLEAHHEELAILRSFFVNAAYDLPDSIDEYTESYLLNATAITLAYLQHLKEALKINRINLGLDLSLNNKSWSNIRNTVTSIGWIFWKTGKYSKELQYHKWANEIATLTESEEALFICNYFYFDYLSERGLYREAVIIWEYLERNKNKAWSRSRYQPGSVETIYCYFQFRTGQLKESNLEEAEKLALQSKNRYTLRSLNRLRGMWYIDQSKWAEAANYLNKAIEMARSVGLNDGTSEVLLAFTQYKLEMLKNPVKKAEQLGQARNPNHLFLAELWEAIGDLKNSAKHGLLAYKKYWAEGEPYVDFYYLERTKKLLDRIECPHPVLPPYQEKAEVLLPVEVKLVEAIEELRREKKGEDA